MSKLYILRGVPGSGMSTYGKKIVDSAHDALADFEVVAIHGNHQNVHNVPEESLEKMRAKMVDYPGETVVNTDK